MANLKQDILNNLGNRKYYIELELARQAQDGNMVYSEKIDSMTEILMDIADIDLSTQLIGKYFPDEVPISAEKPDVPEEHVNHGKDLVPNNGQSHAE